MSRVIAALGTQPAREAWDRLGLPGTTVLEIGPGAGHLLAGAAAQGKTVVAVETSARHRAFIKEVWGIERLVASLDDLPSEVVVDVAVAINVLEHVYDVVSFLSAIRQHLAPEGIFFFSTPNAEALVCSIVKSMWSMFKEPDHVSFPSYHGVRAAALAAGLVVERVWSTEMALETPVGLGVAARDFWRERRAGRRRECPGSGRQATAIGGRGSRVLAELNTYRFARYEPFSAACARLGRAATIKAVLRRPSG